MDEDIPFEIEFSKVSLTLCIVHLRVSVNPHLLQEDTSLMKVAGSSGLSTSLVWPLEVPGRVVLWASGSHKTEMGSEDRPRGTVGSQVLSIRISLRAKDVEYFSRFFFFGGGRGVFFF